MRNSNHRFFCGQLVTLVPAKCERELHPPREGQFVVLRNSRVGRVIETYYGGEATFKNSLDIVETDGTICELGGRDE